MTDDREEIREKLSPHGRVHWTFLSYITRNVLDLRLDENTLDATDKVSRLAQ